MNIKDEIRDTKDGVSDHVLGVAEGDVQNRGNGGPQNGGGDRVGGGGVKAEHVPFEITPEMREKFTRHPIVFSLESKKSFTRYWFEKGMEGGIAPSAADFRSYGLYSIFNVALDCFNKGSAHRASISAATAAE